jgi:purine-nucleoside phosphorylase
MEDTMMDCMAREAVAEASAYIGIRTRYKPTAGLVLGSGFGLLAEHMADPDIIPYEEIPHFPRSTVPGHAGRLLLGYLDRTPLFVMQGRSHYYEGYSAAELSLPIRVMRRMGVDIVLLTNAAGGIRPGFQAGDLMVINDHLNLVGLAGHNPLRGPNDDSLGPRFPDMSRAYDAELIALLHAEASAQGITLHEGVYAAVAGPSFETPAEIRFLRAIGADAVGMSTVPEVIVARHAGMRVMGLSLITNVSIDSIEGQQREASHEQVLEAGRRAVPLLTALLEGILRRLS